MQDLGYRHGSCGLDLLEKREKRTCSLIVAMQTECLMQACRQPLPESEVAASLDPEHPEIFFYSMQYDHTVKRFETEWLERDAGIKEDPLRCEVRTAFPYSIVQSKIDALIS